MSDSEVTRTWEGPPLALVFGASSKAALTVETRVLKSSWSVLSWSVILSEEKLLAQVRLAEGRQSEGSGGLHVETESRHY